MKNLAFALVFGAALLVGCAQEETNVTTVDPVAPAEPVTPVEPIMEDTTMADTTLVIMDTTAAPAM
ncbi:MAG: hypothetical protein ACK41D_01955 [Rubricoccaceae bacterium]